jgi:hypothetical protein
MNYKYSTGTKRRLLKDAYREVLPIKEGMVHSFGPSKKIDPGIDALSAIVSNNIRGELGIVVSAFKLAKKPEDINTEVKDVTFAKAIDMFVSLIRRGSHVGPKSIQVRTETFLRAIESGWIKHICPGNTIKNDAAVFAFGIATVPCYVLEYPQHLDKNGPIFLCILHLNEPPKPDTATDIYVDPFETVSRSVEEDSGTYSSPSFSYADSRQDVNTVGPNPLGFKGSPFGSQIPVYLKRRKKAPTEKRANRHLKTHVRNNRVRRQSGV